MTDSAAAHSGLNVTQENELGVMRPSAQNAQGMIITLCQEYKMKNWPCMVGAQGSREIGGWYGTD